MGRLVTRAGALPGLPAVFVSARERGGRTPAGAGLLIHDQSLIDLVRISAQRDVPLAVDLDTVEGLAPDEAAIAFLAERLGVAIIITRRPALAALAPRFACRSLLHVHCLDSTGLERALAAHPGDPVGTALSPGLMLAQLSAAERRRLPAPVVAYGLVRGPEERDAALAAGAAGVVVAGFESSILTG
ncbi:MAG: glycerol-3-phosphate responsive antiterminator [Chloroflexi bacterium]|nr:MAG: glycerol-3-phosphate responsive antiterminator [Chloroflexota bacterium]